MLELMTNLRANGFKTYIVSGGGIEFMSPLTERTYGVEPGEVVGSSAPRGHEEMAQAEGRTAGSVWPRPSRRPGRLSRAREPIQRPNVTIVFPFHFLTVQQSTIAHLRYFMFT